MKGEDIERLERHNEELRQTCQRLIDDLSKFNHALNNGQFDLCECMKCGKPVIALPDGMPMCNDCAELMDTGEG